MPSNPRTTSGVWVRENKDKKHGGKKQDGWFERHIVSKARDHLADPVETGYYGKNHVVKDSRRKEPGGGGRTKPRGGGRKNSGGGGWPTSDTASSVSLRTYDTAEREMREKFGARNDREGDVGEVGVGEDAGGEGEPDGGGQSQRG